jgi:hypothetical protein
MARKKFKTVAGYLRSMSDDLYYAQAKAEQQGRQPIADEDGLRQILNNLLPQLGIGRIDDHERLIDGIQRLQQTAHGDQQTKALVDCLKWLKQPTPRVIFVGAKATSHTMTFRGEEFSEEESARLEEICREQKVSMIDAVRILRHG